MSADPKAGDLRLQAVAAVEQRFTRQRDDLARAHKEEARAHADTRCREIQSFMQNRDTAIRRHRGQMQTIDNRENAALAAMDRRHRTLGGRLSNLFQPGRREREGDAIRAAFEAERMQRHRELNGLQERQAQIEQGARLRYGQADRRMQERFKDERRELAEWQAERREPMVQQQAHAIAEAQLRQGLRHEQTRERTQQGRAL